jgi:hypothetical protein
MKRFLASSAHQRLAHVPHTIVCTYLSRAQHQHDIAITQLLNSWEVQQDAHHADVACISRCRQSLHTNPSCQAAAGGLHTVLTLENLS